MAIIFKKLLAIIFFAKVIVLFTLVERITNKI